MGLRKCAEHFPRDGGKRSWPRRWLRPGRRMSPQKTTPEGQTGHRLRARASCDRLRLNETVPPPGPAELGGRALCGSRHPAAASVGPVGWPGVGRVLPGETGGRQAVAAWALPGAASRPWAPIQGKATGCRQLGRRALGRTRSSDTALPSLPAGKTEPVVARTSNRYNRIISLRILQILKRCNSIPEMSFGAASADAQ